MESEVSKRLARVTGGWLLWLAVLAVFWWDLNGPFNFSGFILTNLTLLGGLVLIICWIIDACYQRAWKLAVVAIIAMLVGSYFYLTTGDVVGIYGKFLLNRHSYESKVDEILRLSRTKRVSEFSQQFTGCDIDQGPPVRVAFVWDGIIDNWVGVVYDPTGEVLKANEFREDWSNWNDPKLHSVKKLFGGDMTSARHLIGPWYFCSFT